MVTSEIREQFQEPNSVQIIIISRDQKWFNMLLMPQHECNITSRRVTHHSSLRQRERRAQETTSYFQLKR